MSVLQDAITAVIPRFIAPLPSDVTAEQILEEIRTGTRDEAPPSGLMRRSMAIEPVDVAGRRVLRVAPKNPAKRTGDQFIYWHGGSWSAPLLHIHWAIIGELVRRSGAEAWVPSYPLAPEHTVDNVFPLVDALSERVAEVAGEHRFVVSGDSAGGTMSLLQAQRDRDAGRRPADHLVLFAPASDLRFNNPELMRMVGSEPMLRMPALHATAAAWAGDRALNDPAVSPLFGRLENLPPLTVFQGNRDLLMPDNVLLVDRVRRAGGQAEWVESRGGFHVYVGAVITPEAWKDLGRAARLIRG